MYFLMLALYAIGLFVFGSAILLFLGRMEKMKALLIGLIGILIKVGTNLIF
ncbi:hypothetical protein [Bacillus sp. ISL-45]|uniref:hypothetical protein n=1 Tax=Bacillus sp. ISL-45 TaxID=2819128 RepID=UPI001BE93406|nr:hypothetical protein [Bacillus sp. ISL-45]MBT2663338.1 hypothetical protein [Bacillus sp. ISL-45]